jgi:hypothetical protein
MPLCDLILIQGDSSQCNPSFTNFRRCYQCLSQDHPLSLRWSRRSLGSWSRECHRQRRTGHRRKRCCKRRRSCRQQWSSRMLGWKSCRHRRACWSRQEPQSCRRERCWCREHSCRFRMEGWCCHRDHQSGREPQSGRWGCSKSRRFRRCLQQ